MPDTPPAPSLPAIRERASKSTRGPWVVGGEKFNQSVVYATGVEDGPAVCNCDCSQHFIPWRERHANAEFIAHAREDIPALLAEHDRLKAQVADLRAALEKTQDRLDWAAEGLRDPAKGKCRRVVDEARAVLRGDCVACTYDRGQKTQLCDPCPERNGGEVIEQTKKCDKPDCPRRCRWDTHYCCTPCYLADTQKAEIAAHCPDCDVRWAERQKR